MRKVAPTLVVAENTQDADSEVESILGTARQQQRGDEVALPKSRFTTRIPETYHVKKKSALFPSADEEQYTVERGEDGLWNSTIFPSLKPYGREEVLLLENAFNQMLDDQAENVDPEAPMQAQIRKAEVCSQAMHEIVRQIAAACPERPFHHLAAMMPDCK